MADPHDTKVAEAVDNTSSGGKQDDARRSRKAKRASGRKGRSRKAAKQSSPPKTQRPYPRVPFNTALQVAQKIKELNGGNAWTPDDVAAAIHVGPRTTKFYYITASARDFGLTLGTRETEQIELTPLGREIVYAGDPEVERKKKAEAFFTIEVFKKVYEHYRGASLPEMKYLGNTLEREFELPPVLHEEFVELFRQNCRELGLDSSEGATVAIAEGQVGSGPATVIVGEPRSGGKRRAFVIMPFTERHETRPKGFFDEVLRSLLTPAGVNAGFSVETGKRQAATSSSRRSSTSC